MKSALIFAVTIFLLSLVSSAQVAGIAESTTVEAGPHTWRQTLTNESTSSLDAYVVSCKPKWLATTLQDVLLNGGRSLHPGESINVTVNEPSKCDSRLRAAIFSDGHAEGDPAFVNELYAHRRGAEQALEQTIELLASIYTEHRPFPQIADLLKQKSSNSAKTPEEGVGYSLVMWAVNRMLSQPGHTRLIPAEARVKEQLPEIDDVMKQNGFTGEEAGVFLLNKRLEAWMSALRSDGKTNSTQNSQLRTQD